jgi:mono/diheme cytochrome c family protein
MPIARQWIVVLSSAAICSGIAASAVIARSATSSTPALQDQGPAADVARPRGPNPFDARIVEHATDLLQRGRQIFRFDTFGDEVFWGDTLKLHEAIEGERFGGVGSGLSPAAALSLGLKIDADALSPSVIEALRHGRIDLQDPAMTIAAIDAGAVVGLSGKRDRSGGLSTVGIQCSLCHSTVDDIVAPGVGRRLDGWPNRDLDVGAIIALAPDLSAVADLLQTDQATVRTVLRSWGPGKFDAQLFLDGKAFRPDGRSAATLLPAAFGLAGVNLHTYTGWGGVSHWNAFVANLEMHGQGTFIDARLNDARRFPVAARAGFAEVRHDPDLTTGKLAALQFYQLSIPAPTPPPGSFDPQAARAGRDVFNGSARCAQCHVPPLFTEPGWNMHTAAEIGIDAFQSTRSPDERYRTTPLAGLFARQKGGFYHDGRFADLRAVVEHYNRVFGLNLSEQDKTNLIEYLRSL